ncbi:hypothetical protein LCGC14_2122590 [marine sediment metagenome]|uniref:Uncharacterized protein n=1 Tax=marine sediment metagenome TaxID=412755 RepID=A0A0F9E3R3_9ZZZZ
MTTKKEKINFLILSILYIVFLVFYATIGFLKEKTWVGLVSVFSYLLIVIIWSRSLEKKKVEMK